MALNVARGMSYLHCRPNERVVHGDLKTANLLVDAEYEVYITDFGLARMQVMMIHDRMSSATYTT
jgi:serine/threonine protein kinase